MKILNDISELSQKKIYIYGAGVIGKLFAKSLNNYDVTPSAFVVSEKSDIRRCILGISIIHVSELKKNSIVVIATLADSVSSIQDVLFKYDISDVYLISEHLIFQMRVGQVSDTRERASIKVRVNEMNKLIDYDQCDCVITDSQFVNEILKHDRIISSRDFVMTDAIYGTLFVMIIDWGNAWKKLVEKVFTSCDRCVFSFRYKYINLQDYSIIRTAKKQGFELTATRRFFRDELEYQTEDVLLLFEKRDINRLFKDCLCTGCGYCDLKCPVNAIQMKENEYGYKKPYVDSSKCIGCMKCINECPVYEDSESNAILHSYAYMAQDEGRRKSSSGGAFGEIAEKFIDEGGFVCGAAWSDDFSVGHVVIDDKRDLDRLRMSKYIRSDIRKAMSDVRELLKNRESVLFVGCPCQVAAIKKYQAEYAERLYTIDLICAEAPSHKIMSMYLRENFSIENVESISFREKKDGWRPDSLTILYKDGNEEIRHAEDIGQRVFHSRMMMDVGCEHCNFLGKARVGDMSIGDAWGVIEHDPTLNDGKGTSSVFVNSEKGEYLYSLICSSAKLSREIPFEWSYSNRTTPQSVLPHPNRDRFYERIKENGFNKSANESLNGKYDIGLVGNWSYPNYGSELTYFALNRVLKKMGYSVLMIEWAEDSEWKTYGCTQLFDREPYANEEISFPAVGHWDLAKYNKLCDIFIFGSDQLLNPFLYKRFGKCINLDWVSDEKKKIGYAFSFGHNDLFYEEEDRRELEFFLKKYDAISVREQSAVNKMKEFFDISCSAVLDPVFLCEKDEYVSLIKEKAVHNNTLFAYILDPSEQILQIINDISEKNKIDLKLITDAASYEGNSIVNNQSKEHRPLVEEWLDGVINSDYVIADSFHGICFAIMFHKKFIAICNKKRGRTRFESILSLLGLMDRMVDDITEIDEKKLFQSIDYDAVDIIMNQERDKSMIWLQEALNKKHQNKYSSEFVVLTKYINELERRIYDMRGGI